MCHTRDRRRLDDEVDIDVDEVRVDEVVKSGREYASRSPDCRCAGLQITGVVRRQTLSLDSLRGGGRNDSSLGGGARSGEDEECAS